MTNEEMRLTILSQRKIGTNEHKYYLLVKNKKNGRLTTIRINEKTFSELIETMNNESAGFEKK